jgi:CheY-like chemotaxis protein
MDKKILIVDDSKALRTMIAEYLAPFGVRIFEADNGEQGLGLARTDVPDLILLDYHMPVMDGFHALVELKADPALQVIPVVMLAPETEKETVMKLMNAGLTDCIPKPFTREVLLQKINAVLGLYSGHRAPPEPAAANSARQAVAKPEKPVILAIDGKEHILSLLREYLGEQFRTITAQSGRAALAAIARAPFDYMFLDLGLPDMNGFEIYEIYLTNGRNEPSPHKVVAMTQRSAHLEIDQALSLGIGTLLYKPFTRNDVANAANILVFRAARRKKGYLTVKGNLGILKCPPENSPKFHAFASALAFDIISEIDAMANEGMKQLIIRVGDGFLSNLGVTRSFIDLVERAQLLSISVRLVADSPQARSALKQFAETAGIPADSSLQCALNSVS